MSDVTVFCFFASYSLALTFEIVRASQGLTWLRWPALLSAAAGLLAHTVFLWERGQAKNLPPLLSSPQDWLLVVAWVACLLYLFVVAYDHRVGIGLFALPVVILFVAVSYFSSDATGVLVPSEERALRGWLMLHATLLGVGIAAVIAGIVLSLMYLVQHRRLRHKRARPAGMKLLSLERLSQWNRLSILVAVPLLSLGMGIGFLLYYLARREGEPVVEWDPFVIASSIAWVVMIAVLGRAIRLEQPAGKVIARRTLLAFGFLLTTLLGLQLATGGGHAVREGKALPADGRPATEGGTTPR